MTGAVVVGSGPNGLAAAIVLAEHGVDVRVLEAADRLGGGTRSSELTLPGLIHDDCSAVHPMGVGSPFFRQLGLERHGLTWRWPEVDLVHPLDHGRAGVLWRDLDRTAEHLGADGPAWRRVFGPPSRRFDDLVDDVFRPMLHVPSHPSTFGSFALRSAPPASWTVHRWHSEEARALFGGTAAHAMSRLDLPLSSSVGMLLIAAAHAHGWPVAEGGSGAIVDALVARGAELGVEYRTGRQVDGAEQFEAADLVLLDTTPRAAAGILGGRLPASVRRSYLRYRHGPGAFKVDFAIEGDVPWTNDHARRAGTLHLGGTFSEIEATERTVARGVLPSAPFVLVGQQYLADPTRSNGDLHPLWAYAHVPHGWAGDVTSAVVDQIERFAPGFRDRVRATHVRSVTQMELHNQNYVGGDIAAGANDPWQLLVRPRLALDPYATGVPGVYLCSSATPPGAGVHGMCGVNAAHSALRSLERAG